MEDIFKNLGEHEKKASKAEYDKTKLEKQQEWFDWVKSLFDWNRLGLDILFYCILLVGAVLMYFSLYNFTQSVLVSIGSVAFSEAGIVGWKWAANRSKNTQEQLETAKHMRNWHVYSSVILMVSNLIIESSKTILEDFGFRINGVIWIVFGVIAFMAYKDLKNYIKFIDTDRETIQKRDFESHVSKLNAETEKKQLDAIAEAKQIEADSLVEYMKQNAPELARLRGKIEAAKKMKKMYEDMNLTPAEVDSLMEKIERPNSKESDVKSNARENTARKYIKTGKYSKKQSEAESLSKENNTTEDPPFDWN